MQFSFILSYINWGVTINFRLINLHSFNYVQWMQNAREDNVFALKYTAISPEVPWDFLSLHCTYILNEVVRWQKGDVKTWKVNMSTFLVSNVDKRVCLQMLHNGILAISSKVIKGQWRKALMFSLICAWINRWVNNRETGDLRRHRCTALNINNKIPWQIGCRTMILKNESYTCTFTDS